MTTIERLQKAATLMGKSICFHSDRTPRVLTLIADDGMVEVSGMSGQFAPHLFTVLGERPFVPCGLTLLEWLNERLANTQRIADSKSGAEKEHWLEDGRYFEQAIALHDQSLLAFRRLLFYAHGCDGKYGDDGEMQCNDCRIDFKRDAVGYIELRIQERGLQRLKDGQ